VRNSSLQGIDVAIMKKADFIEGFTGGKGLKLSQDGGAVNIPSPVENVINNEDELQSLI
jgi:hypothetical protein